MPNQLVILSSSSLWMSCVPQINPDGGHAEAVRLEALDDGLLDLLAVRQAEVVVGAHDELVPRGRVDLRALRSPDDLLVLVQAALPNGIELVPGGSP